MAKMANRRTANSLVRQLEELDQRIDEKYRTGNLNSPLIERWMKKQEALVQTLMESLPVVAVPVADGLALYLEKRRNSTLAFFEFLYGGSDGYVSPWGETIAIPLAQADKMLPRKKKRRVRKK